VLAPVENIVAPDPVGHIIHGLSLLCSNSGGNCFAIPFSRSMVDG
jgi:hypothetical protein